MEGRGCKSSLGTMFPRCRVFLIILQNLAGACTAGGERLAACHARGGHLHWSLRCGFRRAIVDAGGAASSGVLSWAASSGSATAWWMGALHGSAVVGGWFMVCRHEPCPKRWGRRMVAMCGSHSSRPATHFPTCLVSHSLDRCFVAYDVEWIFNTLSARARASNSCARTQAYPLDCLFSLRVIDRSIFSGSVRNTYRF